MITKEDIQSLAGLARIKVDPSEAESLRGEIDSILGYVGQIEKMPSQEGLGDHYQKNVLRDDVVTNKPGEYTDSILNNAPSVEGKYIKVKKILQ